MNPCRILTEAGSGYKIPLVTAASPSALVQGREGGAGDSTSHWAGQMRFDMFENVSNNEVSNAIKEDYIKNTGI